ncbi:nosip [Symbiodinium sp. CCMP2592]|nr:nosip [Symbiodinium sp. CCMP2592]
MTDSRDGSGAVPTWDGSARAWRRYTREVAWYVQSTPAHKRRHCASKLMGRLTGPARLLAMSWQQAVFDVEDGTTKLLQKLASSPLVRRSLPNAAAICQQYFSFRRSAHESIGNFLVRETLVHEEFVEALIRLHEEKLGVSQSDRDFGLPAVEASWKDYEWQGEGWEPGDWWWYEDEIAEEGDGEGAAPAADSPEDPAAAEGEGAEHPPRDDSPGRVRATTGSSPSHREEPQLPKLRSSPPSVSPPAEGLTKPIDELSVADSFIMGVLRGWRLLQAAGLTAEEKRDILSTSRNSLDYEVVAQALQGLWDEQLLGQRPHGNGGYQNYAAYHDDMDLQYQDATTDWDDEENSWWDHTGYAAEWGDPSWWDEDYDEAYPATTEEPNEPDDDKYKEAQQAEKIAEQLALEARRTWTEAQKATQQLRRDRGFGASHGAPGQCFLCGGPHMARMCPNRTKGKGQFKGKPGSFNGNYADYESYFVGKGKGKSKGKFKGKTTMWMEGQAAWHKGKGKHREPPRSVNAYSSDMYLAGLQVSETMDLSSMSSARPEPQTGMLDSGATASAAPEAVVKGLIEAVLSRDRGARIDLEQYARPYFRFGNGKWGRALGRTTITSNVSGSTRKFSLYTLPNPSEYYTSHFDKGSLVPVLIGMDFLGPAGMGLIIDFSTGLALQSKEEHPEIFHLKTNAKGHYVLDIVEFLTQGHVNLEGQAHLVVSSSTPSSPKTLLHHALELGTVWFDLTAQEADVEHEALIRSRNRLLMLHQHSRELRQRLCAAAASTSQMSGPSAATRESPTSSSRSPGDALNHGDPGADSHLADQGQHQAEGEGSSFGPIETGDNGPSRPPNWRRSMALPLPARAGQGAGERSWSLGPLRGLQSTTGVCSPQGESGGNYEGGEPQHGETYAHPAGEHHGTCEADLGHLPGHAAEDRRGGAAEPHCAAADDGSSGAEDYYDNPVYTNAADNGTGKHKSRRLQQQLAHRERQRGGSSNCLRQHRNVKPCSSYHGHKIMAFASLMTAATTSLLAGLHLHDRDGLWEISAAPHSLLSDAAAEHGLQPRKINLSTGYDLYKASTWDGLLDLLQRKRPVRLWFSLPCTKWCPWTAVDYDNHERREQLETYRRRERRMLWNFNKFAKASLAVDPDLQLYFEWPTTSRGWRLGALTDLEAFLEQHEVPWLHCRVDGCCYGLMDEDGDSFVQKKWSILTTDEQFHRNFKAKICPGNHKHNHTACNSHAKESYYPPRMVQAIARHWRGQLVPGRHLHLLSLPDDLPALTEEPNQQSDDYNNVAVLQECDDVTDEEMDLCVSAGQRLTLEAMAREARLRNQLSFDMLETIMTELFNNAVPRGPPNLRWNRERQGHMALGAYSHGAFGGVCKSTYKYKELVLYINGFIQQHCPGHEWTSLMLTKNCRALPHRDHHNMVGSTNLLFCTGSFTGGGLWIGQVCDDLPKLRRRMMDGTYKAGHVKETKNKFVYFQPKVDHATEQWRGTRFGVSAYTTRMLPHLKPDELQALRDLGFKFDANRSPGSDELDALPAEQDKPPSASDLRPDDISQAEYDSWVAKIAKFHKAAGHPTNRNLAKIIQDAGHPTWKMDVALHHHCPACESLRAGGTSSGRVPPASTHLNYSAWEAVGIDTGEWIPPGKKTKVKFIVFVDMATRLRVVQPLFVYDFLTTKVESGQDFIRAFSERWLGSYPKPKLVIMDSAKSFVSETVNNFLSDLNIQVHIVAEKEHWANGLVESTVQDLKQTSSAIHLDSQDVEVSVVMHLAAAALNATEFVAGYSSHQWAFGTNHSPTDEDVRTYQLVEPKIDYARLITARQRAEEIAVATRARRVLSKLGNTTVRQPLREFSPMQLVKVWRHVWPREQHKGPRGGYKKSGRPHWIGPGRVMFSEVLPHQQEGDHRRHVVWVLIGSQLLRCSVHSVRPVTEVERFQYETTTHEDVTRWKSLADVLPRKEYHDLVDDVPDEDEVELPDLPLQPDETTMVNPPRRLRTKTSSVRFQPYGQQADDEPDGEEPPDPLPPPVNDYQPATSSTTPPTPTTTPHRHADSQPTEQPDPKRSRREDITWVQELEAAALQEHEEMDIFHALQETQEFLKIEFDVEPPASNRQRKFLERNPVAYMVKKMRDSEVSLSRLPPRELSLFNRAKAKEVDSFLRNEAVRKCLNDEEVKQAYESGRIVRARWVLTWKSVPPEDQADAERDARENPDKTLHDSKGRRKAKARIVLLGFQHPNLLDPTFKTSSPVQSTLGRNLLYLLAAHHQWDLEGLDLATAFLQTMPTEADSQLYTSGVEELREALGVDADGIMKILRNIYGSTTAPRGLWLDLHKTLTKLGGIAVMGERCMWIWLSKSELDRGRPRLIGAMGGHVDDFHRLGDKRSPEWMAIREAVDKAYKWGTAKTGKYRHAGTDITSTTDEQGRLKIVVDQSYYIDGIQDLEVDAARLRQDGPLQPHEVAACRTALGALQWVAVQSQPQLCSRCNLLLTEVVSAGTLQTAREIQAMVSEIRRESFKLEFVKFDRALHWTDLVFISMGDQAHNNRGKGDSTGGLLTLVAGPEAIEGKVCPMTLLAWRTWKLRRKALGSNDAEVQSIYEAEDQNFRVRLLWTEMHGARDPRRLREDLVEASENQCLQVKGILCTDSRGGYDAIERNESPLLGLSNMRAALQAFSLRENLARVACELRWLASDYNLADAMTKKKAESRLALLKYLQTRHWAIAFDPSFTSAKRSKKQGHTAVGQVDKHFKLKS